MISSYIRRVIEIWPNRKRILGHHIEKLPVRMDCEERGIDNLGRKFGPAQLTGSRTKTAHVNAFAVTASGWKTFLHISEAGVGTEVNEVFVRGR